MYNSPPKTKRPTLITPITIPTDEEIKQQPRTISLNKGKKRKFDFNIKPSVKKSNHEKNTTIQSPLSPWSTLSPMSQSFKKIKIDHPNIESPKN